MTNTTTDQETLRQQLRDAIARKDALPKWKVSLPEDVMRAHYEITCEIGRIRTALHEIGRPCPACPDGRVRTHQEAYYDMDRCDTCNHAAVVYSLGD
jgi:hypothetical protein